MSDQADQSEAANAAFSEDVRPGGAVLLTIDGVAARCAVSPKVVRRWIRDDELPIVRLPGSGASPIVRISDTDLELWLIQFRGRRSSAPEQTLHLHGRRHIRHGTQGKSVTCKTGSERVR